MLTNRDRMILALLKRFRVLSRDQLGKLTCEEVTNPAATINRIMKRLSRDLHVTQIVRPKDEPYLYMPNPTIIHPESQNIRHFLGIADIFIQLNKPEIFEVEPVVSGTYRPDIYCRLPEATIIEFQRSTISLKRMQKKIDDFLDSHIRKLHDAKTLWVMSDTKYNISLPPGYTLIQSSLYERKGVV